jgi:hypothetical protein
VPRPCLLLNDANKKLGKLNYKILCMCTFKDITRMEDVGGGRHMIGVSVCIGGGQEGGGGVNEQNKRSTSQE